MQREESHTAHGIGDIQNQAEFAVNLQVKVERLVASKTKESSLKEKMD